MSKYVVTDPCYILPDDVWSECIKKAGENDKDWGNRFDEQVQAALSAFVGSKSYACSTGFGDWDNDLYGPNVLQSEFCADSGMVSVCEYNNIVAEALTCPDRCYAVFTAEGPIKVNFDRSARDWTVVEIEDAEGECWHTHIPDDGDDEE